MKKRVFILPLLVILAMAPKSSASGKTTVKGCQLSFDAALSGLKG
ncbi:MAG TPA: hypothetical protein VMX75_08675 [Spirochaetia bacterium]|nr:hypothetical protein [Spirochaetia bacterium]